MLVSKINIVRLAYSAQEISNCDTYNTKTCEVPLTASLDKPNENGGDNVTFSPCKLHLMNIVGDMWIKKGLMRG